MKLMKIMILLILTRYLHKMKNMNEPLILNFKNQSMMIDFKIHILISSITKTFQTTIILIDNLEWLLSISIKFHQRGMKV